LHYAIIKDNRIVNVCVWDGVTPFNPDGELVSLADLPAGAWTGWERDAHGWIQESFVTVGWPNDLTGERSWRETHSVDAQTRLQLVTDRPYRSHAKTLKVTVQPGDKVLNWTGERAEVLTAQDGGGNNITQVDGSAPEYVAFSVYVPSGWTWPTPGSGWGIILQMPPGYTGSPTFAFYLRDIFEIGLNGGDWDVKGNVAGTMYQFSDGGVIQFDQWTDFIVRLSFAKAPTANVDVWRRDQAQSTFTRVLSLSNVETLSYWPSHEGLKPHYWKQGFYRSESLETHQLWLSGLVIANTFDLAEYRAFGTNAGQP
jgi:hypothetical protein